MTMEPATTATTFVTRLPEELVALILEAIPADDDHERLDRRRTLYRCCLASRQLFRVAQPLLWARIALQCRTLAQPHDPLALLIESAARVPALARRAQSIEIDFENGGLPHRIALRRIVAVLPKLREVRLRNLDKGQMDLVDLEPLAEIRHLSLRNVRLAASAPVSFPHLASLDLVNVVCRPDRLNEFLALKSLPALRILSLRRCRHQAGLSAERRFFPSLDRELVNRLELIQLRVSDHGRLPFHPVPAVPPVLFAFDPISQLDGVSVSGPPIHHLKLADHSANGSNLHHRLAEVLSMRRVHPELRLILAPSIISRVSRAPSAAGEAVRAALRELARAGIEVRTFMRGEEEDGGVPSEFKRYLREQAAVGARAPAGNMRGWNGPLEQVIPAEVVARAAELAARAEMLSWGNVSA
ncbi:hypothetical protein JCM10449v2_003252 [Rhodotorula kratochvilovae]